ncbi:MAG: hypothetical protein ACKVHO_08660 [Verrucomicrobiia bacterium]
MKRIILTLMSAALVAGFTPTADAADKKPAKKEAAKKGQPSKKKRTTYPYRGTISKIDGNMFMFKQKNGERTIAIGEGAKITKDGKKAKASDLKVGGYVTGSVKKVDGKEVAQSVYMKPKPAPRTKGKGKKPAKKKKSDDS